MLDPFEYSPLRPAPTRDLYKPNLGSHRCLEPGGRPGAGRLNGSNGPSKLVHIITKRIFLMLDPFEYSPLRPAPGRDLYQPNLGPHRCLEPGGRGRPSDWVKWTNEIGAYHHKTHIFDVGPVWIFAPTACPRTGPIPNQSRSP